MFATHCVTRELAPRGGFEPPTFRLTAMGAKFLNALFGVAYAGCQLVFGPSVGLPWATNSYFTALRPPRGMLGCV